MKQIYNLKQDLTIPIDDYRYIVYKSDKCGLSYRITYLDHLSKVIKMSLIVVDKDTGSLVDELSTAEFNSSGTQVLRNEDEYNEYISKVSEIDSVLHDLDKAIFNKQQEVNAATEDTVDALTKELNALIAERDSKKAERDAIPVVVPDNVVINTYDDVVKYIEGGVLNDAGIQWGLGLKFKGITLGEIVDIPTS